MAVSLGASALALPALKVTVKNVTTRRPAAGDEVVLLSLANGMTEVGRGKTDLSGHFRFEVRGKPAPQLVRVVHQGVAYHSPAPPGVSSVEVQVYDVAARLDGLSATLNMRIQTEGDALQVIEEIAVRNASEPPRTLVSERPFEIQLPAEAELVAGKMQIGGGKPVTVKPAPGGGKGRYYFPVPLPPGNARLAVAYRLPYRGEAVIEPHIQYPLEQFAVVLPKSMKLELGTGDGFRPMPGKSEADVQVVRAAVKPGQPLAFRISGTGTLAGSPGGHQQPQGGETARRGPDAPKALPGPRSNFRWFLAGGFALVLAAGIAGFLKHKRKQAGDLSGSSGPAQERSIVAIKLAVIAVVPVLLYAYSTGPPAAKTGAPGEGTCRECHGGGAAGGKVEISFPGQMVYTPGVKQQLTVTITDAVAKWYGFQVSARLASDNSQAGTLNPASGESNIRVICADFTPRGPGGCPSSTPIEYIEHSPARQTNTFRVEWTPPATDQGPVRIYVAANAANGNGDPTGDSIYTASYTLNSQAASGPKITAAGIVNGASFAAGISPGSFISIFGENLAPRTRSWDGAIQGTALPSQLEGVSVTVGGKPAYLALISPGQLNALLGTDNLTGPLEVKVTTPQASASATATVARYAPGFFLNSLDRKYIAATHADNALVARVGLAPDVSSRPAQPGEEIVLWGTGFGPTAEQAPSGQVLSKAYPLADLGALKVTFGGRDARITFAGVTIAGVNQINVVTPADLADGDHAVRAEIGGARTQDIAFLAVQGAGAPSAGIQVSYRLDPWLVSNNYQGALWVSPPVFGPVTQGGKTFALEVRAAGLDAQGQVFDLTPQWIPADPGMVTVSPGQGNQVTITVQRAGQSSVQVTSQGISKELAIKAVYQGEALLVEIAQKS